MNNNLIEHINILLDNINKDEKIPVYSKIMIKVQMFQLQMFQLIKLLLGIKDLLLMKKISLFGI